MQIYSTASFVRSLLHLSKRCKPYPWNPMSILSNSYLSINVSWSRTPPLRMFCAMYSMKPKYKDSFVFPSKEIFPLLAIFRPLTVKESNLSTAFDLVARFTFWIPFGKDSLKGGDRNKKNFRNLDPR